MCEKIISRTVFGWQVQKVVYFVGVYPVKGVVL